MSPVNTTKKTIVTGTIKTRDPEKRTKCKLTDTRTEMAFMAIKTALFAVFKASSRVTRSFFQKCISVNYCRSKEIGSINEYIYNDCTDF